ncbi:DNA repair protein XRCC1 [Tripterygium wilfordii]|uniref:DNA repair protein XRCC1 n=1 Tax=Tripterygium wilfordii TaxID=458696 RepID=A0A7J7BYE9_TRIWF|nr:DNA-repair protein XRCC1-like [Tripterygium wilfordii]KAF5726901.1 DNA repair protein XRCC1 [Tripterygium wilfordii]
MSCSKKSEKRNLPLWTSSKENAGKSNTARSIPSSEVEQRKKQAASSSSTTDFSKLLEGVIFVLSGFINPERSTLRSQALAMGAEYQPDWNDDCTLLVCAFQGTPKFRQVEGDCGTIVSKDWISKCYSKKKLVDIDSYLMHAGKPWRRSIVSHETHDQKASAPKMNRRQVETGPQSKSTASASSKQGQASDTVTERFSPDKVKKWAIDDLNKTIYWLESQEEKPEPSEIKQIAAGGILTCLQDAIVSLEQKQDVRQIMEQWNFIPRVVEELVKLEATENVLVLASKDDLCKQAKACKQIYEVELGVKDDYSTKTLASEAAGYDSDETIEMTEEEIDLAYNNVASKLS